MSFKFIAKPTPVNKSQGDALEELSSGIVARRNHRKVVGNRVSVLSSADEGMMQARDMIAKLSKLSTEVSNIDEELNYLVAHRLMLDRVKRRLTKSIEDSEVQTENLQASKSQLYDG